MAVHRVVFNGDRGGSLETAGSDDARFFFPRLPPGLFVRGVHCYASDTPAGAVVQGFSIGVFPNRPADDLSGFATGEILLSTLIGFELSANLFLPLTHFIRDGRRILGVQLVNGSIGDVDLGVVLDFGEYSTPDFVSRELLPGAGDPVGGRVFGGDVEC